MARRCRLLSLPAELIKAISCDLDALSKIYIRTSCKELRAIVEPHARAETFSLTEEPNHFELESLNAFVDHIYERVVSSDVDRKCYHMIRQPETRIVFSRKRKRASYEYSVTIEDRGEPAIEVTYDSRAKRYWCRRVDVAPVDLPTVLYVCAIRFMRKIYKERPVLYNFDEGAHVPAIARKMLSKSYDGALVSEVVFGNFSIP